ncbi:OsmC family protein [Nodosilinea sp. FACHB-131]|uniref:OsmC family protein n=1 Tax=Cyanophyceae TaxID=3028117 RepID=UPI00168972DC|nr:OsmC family protein [Nodosilinea sp. FACHB-131]MBD1876573.1 OsmC family protein [Nodosilinea sp. FACHB-131]
MTAAIRVKPTTATFKLRSQGKGVAQVIEVDGSQHTIQVDAAPVFGGHDEHPSPIAYALSSLISCSQVTAQLVAKDLGIQLNGFEFDISADLDTAVLVNGSRNGNPNFEQVAIRAVVDTSASATDFQILQAETERRCPIFQLFQRSGIPISNHWSIRA